MATVFLVGLTISLLYGITTNWPACDPSAYATATPTPTPNNQNNANAGTNANTNRNANVNANTNTNANLIANANTIANANLITNTNTVGSVTPPPPTNQNQAGPVLSAVEPASGRIKGGNPVIIRGSKLARDDVVKFDEVPADREGEGGAEAITVKAPRHEEGRVDVTVYRDGELKSRLPGAYTYTCPAPTGSGLFYMLIMAGALGGCIHAMRSLWWYVGNQELRAPWLSMYFLLPFIGAAMAMLFSLLIVAGIVDNTTGRSTSLFIIAVAGLVGMFSQQAALKLTDVANAFFTKPGPGKDSKPQESQSVGERGTGAGGPPPAAPKVTGLTPKTGRAAGRETVEITGTGFTSPATVIFGDALAKVKSVTATKITVETPEHAVGAVEVSVISGGQNATPPATFTYVP